MAERNYDFTEIKTRIIIRNDTSENWEGSTIVLEKGEPAIEYDAVNKTAKIKFGDGVSKFSELPFSTLTPSEVNDLIDSIEAGGAQITTVTTSGDGNAVTGGSISDDGTTLTLTKGTEFVPASGGIFSGDVTVNGDLTVDNIKTSSEITITPTTNITVSSDGQKHDNSKITFVNTNKVGSDDNISIEASYTANMSSYAGGAYTSDSSILNLNAEKVSISGSLNVKTINDLIFITEYENSTNIHTIKPSYAGLYNDEPRLEFIKKQNYPTYEKDIKLFSDTIFLNGEVKLSNDPTSDMTAATKKYVDDSVSSITVDSLINGTKTLILNGGSATE